MGGTERELPGDPRRAAGRGVDGRRIAVQLDGVGDPELLDGLREAGADVVELPVYRAVAAADPQLVARIHL